MNDTASLPSSAAFADASSGHKYFDDDAHYQSLALGVVGELDQNVGLILLTGSPPPDTDLLARHLERECSPKRYVRTIHGGTVPSVVSLVVAACPSAVLVVDAPADITSEILQQLSCGPSSDDQYRAAVVLLGPDSLARALLAPGSKDGKSAMPAWMRFRHLARHEVEPFIRFQLNEAHLDQAIFKAPLVSLIESYADGDPAVVNRLADGILTAARGRPLESFAEVVADLRGQIGEIRDAGAASPLPVPTSTVGSGEGNSIAPVPVLERTAELLETTNDLHVSAASVAPPEITSEATGSSLSIAAHGTPSISVPGMMAEPHRFVAPEDGEPGSQIGSAMQEQVTSNNVTDTDELQAAPAASTSASGGATEDRWVSPTPAVMPPMNEPLAASLQSEPAPRSEDRPIGAMPAEGAAGLLQGDPAPHVNDDERALAPVSPATPEEAAFASQASAGAANAVTDASFEIGPEADALESAAVDSDRLPSVVSLARFDAIQEPSQEKSRPVAMRRKWIVPTGIAASIVIAFGAASIPALGIGPVVSAWFARTEGIVNSVKLALAPAPDVSHRRALAGSSEQPPATGEGPDTTISKTIGSLSQASGDRQDQPRATPEPIVSPSEASGDRREQPRAAAQPTVAVRSSSKASGDGREQPTAGAEPTVAVRSPSKANGDRREPLAAAASPAMPNMAGHSPSTANFVAPRAEPNVIDHPPSGRVEVAAQGPTPKTPAQETVVAPIGSPIQNPVIVATRSEPQPLPAPPIAKGVLPSSPAAELFLQRGDQLLAQGDIVPARQFFERAAEAGAAGAALRLAKSYDPIILRRAGVRGIAGDTAKATQWYEKAIASGDIEAELALFQLRANAP